MRKLILIIFIGLAGFIIYAKNRFFIPFASSSKEALKEDVKINHLLLEELYQDEKVYDNTILLGGGSSVILFDTIAHTVVCHDHFVNDSKAFSIISSEIEQTRKNKKLDTLEVALLDFSNHSTYSSLLKENINRGFYLGVYRELLECIEYWQKKYKNLLISTRVLKTPDAKPELLLLIKGYNKSKKVDLAMLIPLMPTNQHLYEFVISKSSRKSDEIISFLNKHNYSYPDNRTLKNNWKIDSKRFELRNVKWNFD